MNLEITDRGLPHTERSFIERVVSAVLEYVERPDFDVSLLLTDDTEISELHQQYLSDPSPTDVMSFDMDGGAEVGGRRASPWSLGRCSCSASCSGHGTGTANLTCECEDGWTVTGSAVSICAVPTIAAARDCATMANYCDLHLGRLGLR